MPQTTPTKTPRSAAARRSRPAARRRRWRSAPAGRQLAVGHQRAQQQQPDGADAVGQAQHQGVAAPRVAASAARGTAPAAPARQRRDRRTMKPSDSSGSAICSSRPAGAPGRQQGHEEEDEEQPGEGQRPSRETGGRPRAPIGRRGRGRGLQRKGHGLSGWVGGCQGVAMRSRSTRSKWPGPWAAAAPRRAAGASPTGATARSGRPRRAAGAGISRTLGRRQRAHAGIGGDEGGARGSSSRPLSRSMHQSFRQTARSNSRPRCRRSRSRRSRTASRAPAVASNITLSRNRSACMGPRGSAWPSADAARCLLEGEFVAQQRGLLGIQMRQHHRHRLAPPGQAAQVRLLVAKSAPARCSRASIAPTCRQWCSRAPAVAAGQARHHGGRLAGQGVHQRPVGAGCGPAPGCRAPPGAASGPGSRAARRRVSRSNSVSTQPRPWWRSSWCSRCRRGCLQVGQFAQAQARHECTASSKPTSV
jgi:hypothetical protein